MLGARLDALNSPHLSDDQQSGRDIIRCSTFPHDGSESVVAQDSPVTFENNPRPSKFYFQICRSNEPHLPPYFSGLSG
jgi:hypothetical protein